MATAMEYTHDRGHQPVLFLRTKQTYPLLTTISRQIYIQETNSYDLVVHQY